ATVNVTLSYPPNPDDPHHLVNDTLELTTEVAARGSLRYSGTGTQVTIAPGGYANFTLSLQNAGSQPVSFTMRDTLLPNWTQTLQVQVPNVGTKTANMTLSVRPPDPTWRVYVQDLQGNNITQVRLAPQQLATVNVTVSPPLHVAEHVIVPIEFIADTGSFPAR